MRAGSRATWAGLVGLRLLIGLFLVFVLAPVSIDDAYRVFHALRWWESPSFYPLPHWPPGYFWIYGLVSGLCADALVAPRLLTLALHLGSGLVLAGDTTLEGGIRWGARRGS